MSVKLMPLEKVARIYSGSNLKNSQKAFGEGGCPWVKVEDLDNTELKTTPRSLSLEGVKQARVSPAQTIFFSSTGTIGKTGIAGVPMAPSNNMFALEFDVEQVDPHYGMYCLRAMREVFKAEAGGAVYDSLRLSVFRKIRIPVPDLGTQRRIAEKLTMLDKSERRQRQMSDEIKEAAGCLFDKYFREAAECAVRGKDSCLKLDECADIVLNGAAKRKQGQGVSVHYVSTAQLGDWEIPGGEAPRIETDPERMERYRLCAGDIVMNRINSAERLGKCGIVLEEPEELTVFGQNTLRIRSRKDMVQPLFLFTWLTYPYMKQYIQSHAKNSTSFQSSLSKQVLRDLPVPQVEMTRQEDYSEKLGYYFNYIRTAEEIIKTLGELQQVWYDKIRLLLQQGEEEDAVDEDLYEKGRYWITPSGLTCCYDSFLECIQVPGRESRTIRLSQLPEGVEIQFLDGVQTTQQDHYGTLEHIRLKRVNRNVILAVAMVPIVLVAGEKKTGDIDRELEENGILSEQQDFGYIRQIQEEELREDETAEQFLRRHQIRGGEAYSRFRRLPDSARIFVGQLSAFQQAVYEEFLLAMQPLACHMVGKQVILRAGKKHFQHQGIQDVIAAVRLLDHAGLLERKQGLYLNYDADYSQGEKRQLILDHRGQPIPIDTWVCADVKE